MSIDYLKSEVKQSVSFSSLGHRGGGGRYSRVSGFRAIVILNWCNFLCSSKSTILHTILCVCVSTLRVS